MSLRLSSVHRSTSRARQQARARNRRRRLWALEALEGRVLLSGNPTVYTVNLTSDTGACSGTDAYPTAGTPSGDLLWADTQANANPNAAGSVIEFDPTVFNASNPQTITLSSTLELSESDCPEVIQGPGANAMAISGGSTIDPSTGEPVGGVGVFQVDSGVTATLSGLTITDGSATNGGGIDNCGTLTVTESIIENSSANSSGGGISNAVTLTVTNSTVENNNASNNGGGIDNSGTLTVTGSTINNNNAGNNGGGIGNSGTLTVTDSTITRNGVGNNGAGIDNIGMLRAVNATIAYNGIDYGETNGGGLNDETGSVSILDNTIVAFNIESYPEPEDITGVPVCPASAYNLIGIGGSGGLTNGRNGNLVGVASPGLAAGLANNGGPTQTIALLAGSPAIGKAGPVTTLSPAGVTDTSSTSIPVANGLVFAASSLPELSSGSYFVIQVDSEQMAVTAVTLNADGTATLTVVRGANGTTAATHPGGAPVLLASDQRGDLMGPAGADIGAFESPVFGNPTVYTVNLTSDTDTPSGTDAYPTAGTPSGDLLWAITQANANTNPAGSMITFDPTVFNSSSPQTIILTSTLELSEAPWPEVIQGPGANAATISGNNAVGVFQVDPATTATLSGLTITEGSTDNGGGGIDNAGALTVTGCTIADNSARYGGGIGNGGTLTVTDSTIEDNSGFGGAVFNSSFWPATITDSTIKGNSRFGVVSVGDLTAANCTIADNSAGGIFLFGGSLTLTNSTVTANSGNGVREGGSGSSVTLSVTNCTIADNSGGGIAVGYGALTLDNSIVACNTGSGGADVEGAPSSLVAYNNLVGVDGTGDLTAPNGNIVGVNPLLGPLQNNGGPTETMALLAGSPAIGAGSVALAVEANGNPLTTDQRGPGYPRIVNGTVDIGAYEAGTASVYTVDLTGDSGSGSGNAGDLSYCIAEANANGNPSGSVIEFDPTVYTASNPQTITLGSTLELSETGGPEVIDGPGGNLVTISGNNAVGVFQVCSGVTATLSGLTITGGQATNGAGINNCGTLTVTDSTIENNNASNNGGGIDNSGTLTVTDSTINDNGGGNNGGGIENEATGMLTICDSTIAYNGANYGGGIDNFGTLTAVNTTIAYNSGGGSNDGAGLYDETGSTSILDDTIVAFNTNPFSKPEDINGGPVSSASAYNLIGSGDSGGLTNGPDGNLVGVADPGARHGIGQ